MSAELTDIAELRMADAAPRHWKRYVFALLLVAAAVVSSAVWTQVVGARNLAIPYMSALMLAGGWLGLRPALAAAIPAFLAHDLLSAGPHFGLRLAAPDLLVLATFVATAALVGGIAGRLTERARLATQRQRRLAALLGASHDLSAAGTPAEVARKLVRHLEAELGVHAAVWSSGPGEPLLAASAAAQETASAIRSPVKAGAISGTGDRWTTLTTAQGAIGATALWFGEHRIGTAELQWVDALLQLGALALDRATLVAQAAAAKSEGVVSVSTPQADARSALASLRTEGPAFAA